MAQPRSVRFMPMVGNPGQAPPPVFSPTQAETQPSLLHSVFSHQQHPSARRVIPQTEEERAADAVFRAQLSKSVDYSLNDEEQLIPETKISQALTDAAETTDHGSDQREPPRTMVVNTNHRAHKGRHVINTARSPSPRRPGGIRDVGGFVIENISPLSTITNKDVFFSPQQASLSDLPSPTSVASETTFKTSLSFKTLRDCEPEPMCDRIS